MAYINGKLETILGSDEEEGSIVVALCGYGAQVPRHEEGASLVARATAVEINADVDGFFSFQVPGNDKIKPDGTYYTIAVKNDNGDLIQINAYTFLDSVTYDLEIAEPFDPSLPLMPLPPLILNELVVADSAIDPMNFDGSLHKSFKIILHNDVTTPWFGGMIPGNLYTFTILEDATGGWDFVWPGNVHNAVIVSHAPNRRTTQTFVADADSELYAVSAGAYYP